MSALLIELFRPEHICLMSSRTLAKPFIVHDYQRVKWWYTWMTTQIQIFQMQIYVIRIQTVQLVFCDDCHFGFDSTSKEILIFSKNTFVTSWDFNAIFVCFKKVNLLKTDLILLFSTFQEDCWVWWMLWGKFSVMSGLLHGLRSNSLAFMVLFLALFYTLVYKVSGPNS
jgi:hypothetical protein